MSLEQKFKANLDRLEIVEGESVLLAVSGGVDSVVLLHLCVAVGLKPTVAHANFRLRGHESEADEASVIEACRRLDVPVFTKSLPLDKTSGNTQGKARELRYSWFAELMVEHGLRLIFTAHHLDDRLETFFINLMKGTGLKGLKSIPERNVRTYRPLLHFRKTELIGYAEQQGLEWRDDSSNQKDIYLRNKIRHRVVPAFEELDGSAVELAGRSLDFLAEADTYFKRAAGKFIAALESDGFVCKIYDPDWDSLFDHPPMHKYVFGELGFEPGQLNDLEKLKLSESGRQVIGKRFIAYRDRKGYVFKALTAFPSGKGVFLGSPMGGEIQAPVKLKWERKERPREFDGGSSEAWLSMDKLQFPLELRPWKNGDRFVPFGMKGSKKVSDYLIDQKVSVPEKEHTYVLLSEGEICWLVGHRTDDRFKLSQAETEAVHFELQ